MALVEEVLHEYGPLADDRLTEIVGRLLIVRRLARRRRCPDRGRALFGALQPLLRWAEGMGSCAGTASAADARAHGRRAPPRGGPAPAPGTVTAAAGDAALVLDAELLNVRGVRARLAVLERQPLTAVHDAIQQAFGWYDDHLYSFWLDGSFFG